MLRQRTRDDMTAANRSTGGRGAAMRPPSRLLPHALLALAAALALLLSGGVDTANAEHTPLVLVGNFDQDAGHGDCAD